MYGSLIVVSAADIGQAFKIIALSQTDDVYPGSFKVPKTDDFYMPILQHLWTPTYPAKKVFVPELERLRHQTFQQTVNMDFGTDGNLQRLTRIVAHMEQVTVPIVGFTFHFIDKEPLFYGRCGWTEVSFLIRGAEGARITSVTYEQTTPTFGIFSLQVCKSVYHAWLDC